MVVMGVGRKMIMKAWGHDVNKQVKESEGRAAGQVKGEGSSQEVDKKKEMKEKKNLIYNREGQSGFTTR